MILLAGDVGGTTSRFLWLNTDNPDCIATPCYYSSSQFTSFPLLLETLLRDQKITQVDYACFGLPGPVAAGKVSLTNLPWVISRYELQELLPIKQVKLINDFHAVALGVNLLQSQDLICLHQGAFDKKGNRLVIGAGTGLGVAPIYQQSGHFYPQPSEAGHLDFAPLNNEQEELRHWFQRHQTRVTYENLLSGSGLESLYQFYFKQQHSEKTAPRLTAAEIHVLAESNDAVASNAMNTFVNIYGNFVGNLALLWPAYGGIYIAGGIGAKIARWMTTTAFTAHFLDRGKMRAMVEKMPIHLVMDDLVGLKGALLVSKQLASPERRGRTNSGLSWFTE
ncbi:MAG: glucokinase [Desulfuromusa sp.]|nr:glucokinase [Desulfuromusa sp.]